MKIRNGFVSNSSSCSFYIKQADRHLSLEEISEYYGINPGLPEEGRVWLTMLIWEVLNSQENYNAGNEDWRYSYDFRSPSSLDNYLSDDNIKWMQETEYYRKDPEYWENAKKLLEEPEKILHFELDTNDCSSGFEDTGLRIPFEVVYDLRDNAENAFLNTSRALGVRE